MKAKAPDWDPGKIKDMKNIKAPFGQYMSAYSLAGLNMESRMGFSFYGIKIW